MNPRTSLAPIAVGGVLLALVGCSSAPASEEAGNDFDLVTPSELSICTDSPFPPFIFEDADSPTGYSGAEIELITAIAERLDLEPVIQSVSFEAIQSGLALNSRQCDVAAAGMIITEERAKNLRFSEGYLNTSEGLLVGPAVDATSLEDLKGARIGVQTGTSGEAYAKEHAPDGAEVVSFGNDAELLFALKAGNIDAILQDLYVLSAHRAENPDLRLIETFETGTQLGFGFRKDGSDALVAAFDSALEEVLSDGTWDQIHEEFLDVKVDAGE